MQTTTDMSDYRPPDPADPKKTISVRAPSSLHRKLAVIQEAWRVLAKEQGVDDGLIEGIDQTYVVMRLLQGRADEELAQWGGMPETEAQRKAFFSAITAAARKSATKSR